MQDFGDKPRNANPDVALVDGNAAVEAGVRNKRGKGIRGSVGGVVCRRTLPGARTFADRGAVPLLSPRWRSHSFPGAVQVVGSRGGGRSLG